MQRLLIILLLGISCFYGCSQKDKPANLPPIEEVLKELYGSYEISEADQPYIYFEKRKDGWYVIKQHFTDDKLEVEKKDLFYDRNKSRYNELPFEKRDTRKTIQPEEYLAEYDLRNFRLQYYYGYKGWYEDVVDELKGRKTLTDDELNALARAYSTWSGGLLSNQYGDAPENEIWRLPLNINCLSPGQIEQFNDLQAKAQECFKKLADRNPGYETVVGKIGVKYANELLFQYTVLLAYANDHAAKMKLPADIYPKEKLDSAKLLLEKCPPNSIFISFGDNDYYPMHYLQKEKGFRRDVYVINYSLLGVDRYIYRAKFPVYDAAAVTISADSSLYTGKNNDVLYVQSSSGSLSVPELLQQLLNGDKDELGKIILTAKEISVAGDAEPKVISLNNARFMVKNQWILLDILENLKGRKICFTDDFIDELSGLNEHLTLNGTLYIYNN